MMAVEAFAGLGSFTMRERFHIRHTKLAIQPTHFPMRPVMNQWIAKSSAVHKCSSDGST
jgi:hypothetical protein